MPDERLEEDLPRAPRRPLDDRAEGSHLVAFRGRRDLFPTGKPQDLAGRLGGLYRG